MKETALKFVQDNNLDFFMETSAKNGDNVQEVFINASKILYKNYVEYKNRESRINSTDSSVVFQNNQGIKFNLNKNQTKEEGSSNCSC